MNLEGEGSIELATSFYGDEMNIASQNKEIFIEALWDETDYHPNVVEPLIEASFQYESFTINSKDSSLDRQLCEVSSSFQPFEVINAIKKSFVEELRHEKIREKDLDNFNLGIMSVLNALNKGESVEEFLRQAYIGCFQCYLCLKCDPKVCEASHKQRLDHHLLNALRVISHVFSKQHISPPDLRSEKRDYQNCKLQHLTELTEDYLQSKPDLKRYKELIRDFQIVSEIDIALSHLRYEFEHLRMQPNEVVGRSNNFMMFSQMEETTDLSENCC